MSIRLRAHLRFVEQHELAAFNDTGAAERTRVAPIEVRSDRPIRGFACDDYRGTGDYGFDESRTVLLLDELDEESVHEVIAEGRSMFEYRTGEGEPPRVERITVDWDKGTITVEATDCERIEWIGGGKVAKTGGMFPYRNQDVKYSRTKIKEY